DNPVVIGQAAEAQALLERYDPNSSRSLVLIDPETTSEVLFRTKRGSLVPMSSPPQDIVLPSSVRRAVDAVAGLPVGTVMLTNAAYLSAPPGDANATMTQQVAQEVQRQ